MVEGNLVLNQFNFLQKSQPRVEALYTPNFSVNWFDFVSSIKSGFNFGVAEIDAILTFFRAAISGSNMSLKDLNFTPSVTGFNLTALTSGSEGPEKSVLLSWRDLLASYERSEKCFGLKRFKSGLSVMHPNHIGAYSVLTVPMLLNGATVGVAINSDVFGICDVMRNKKIEVIHGSPDLLTTVSKRLFPFDKKVELCISGGSPLSIENSRLIASTLNCNSLYDCYGSTEAPPPILYRENPHRKNSDQFRLAPDLEIKLEDDGELAISLFGKTVFTGDKFEMDIETSNYRYLGRKNFLDWPELGKNSSYIVSEEIFSNALSSNRKVFVFPDRKSETVLIVIEGAPSESIFKMIKLVGKQVFPALELSKILVRFQPRVPKLKNGKVNRWELKTQFQSEMTTPILEPLIVKTQDEISPVQIDQFLHECKLAGYTNNESRESVKLHSIESDRPYYWFGFKNDKLVAMAGVQKVSQLGEGVCRFFHRTAILPQFVGSSTGGLSKKLENSALFSSFLQPQLNWALTNGLSEFVVTTNNNLNPLSPKDGLARSHQIFKVLEKNGFVMAIRENEFLYGAYQTIWRLNLEKFNESRIACGHPRIF